MDSKCHTSCSNCLRKKDSLLEGLNQQELAQLDSKRSLVTYNKGETIYKEGGKSVGLLCLSKGKVKITKKGVQDNDQIIELKKPVDFLGVQALLGKREYGSSAVALEDTTVCIIDQKDFFHVLENNNAMSLRIIGMLSDQLEKSNERVVSLTQEHLEGRMAETLLHVMDVYGTANQDKRLINVQLQRSDLASLANMTTANAIRTLSKFNKDGVVALKKRKIKILEKEKLQAMCSRTSQA